MKKIALLPLVLLVIYGCSQPEKAAVSPQATSTVITCTPDFLSFATPAAFMAALNDTRSKSDSLYEQWAQNQGIYTLRQLTIDLYEDELAVAATDTLPGLVPKHGTVYGTYPNSFYVKTVFDENSKDSISFLEPNIDYADYANLVNPSGLVKIGNILYKFDRFGKWMIVGGTCKEADLFGTSSERVTHATNPFIGVDPIYDDGTTGSGGTPPTPTPTVVPPTPSWSRRATDSKGDFAILAYAEFTYRGSISSTSSYLYTYGTKQKMLIRRRFIGSWWDVLRSIGDRLETISNGNTVYGEWVDESLTPSPNSYPSYINFTFYDPQRPYSDPIPEFRYPFPVQFYNQSGNADYFVLRVSDSDLQPDVSSMTARCRVERWGRDLKIDVVK